MCLEHYVWRKTILGANVWIYLDISNTIQLFCRTDLGLEMTGHQHFHFNF